MMNFAKIPTPSAATHGRANGTFFQRIRGWRKNEDGAVLVEYALCLPLLLLMLFLTLEFAHLKMRQISLDRVTDQTFRELRLGLIPNPDHDSVKDAMCAKTLARIILWDCSESLLLQVREVERSVWNLDLGQTNCLDTTPEDGYMPPIDFTAGIENQLMIARACLIQRSLFPPINALRSLPRYDEFGNFALVSKSAFVNEPF
ncbi:TadE/TadG family type IV pilus assembly protein [Ruegeria lacuscaerulensis]|uniref:TadE/TadG family type IV pilus assembly protein n=1 Tax=Ruegeria lacuscaerulensis TaxID=55218 RepID=UPI00147CA94E|nr:TadE/TadG family type IV pilus assembly protein [Ruegeria lacuscaerulensis]